MTSEQARSLVEEQFRAYKATLSNDRRQVLEQIHHRRRGTQGGRCRAASAPERSWCCLQGRDSGDPLFLQVKEATWLGPRGPPAEEPLQHLRASGWWKGQRLMQAASDIFLGWTRGVQARPVLLLAPAARHEGLRAGRGHVAVRDDVLCPDVRLDPRSRPRPIR